MAGPKNYTTEIGVKRTVAEIVDMLGEHGADHVSVTYEDRDPVAVRFVLAERAYTLPINPEGMLDVLTENRAVPARLCTEQHAQRVAWRVVRDWLDAQLALVAAEQIRLDVVMLPYLHTSAGPTLGEQWTARGELPAGQ